MAEKVALRPADAAGRSRLGLAAGVGALAAFVAAWAAVRLSAPAGLGAAALAAGAVAAAVVLALALAGRARVLVPARRLARGIRAVLETRGPETDLPPVAAPLLGDLPEACGALVMALRGARRANRKTAETEAAAVEAQKRWLEAVIQALAEGVLVCSREHRVLLYNRAAERLLEAPALGLGCGLGDVPALGPLRAAMEELDASSAPAVTLTLAAPRPLEARLTRLEEPSGAASGYLVTLAAAEEGAGSVPLPPRPEFYDFTLMRGHRGDAALATRPLRELTFVVFDCETTGLEPLRGDEIVQIGAIRLVRGRVLEGEVFDRLVDPGRPIPPSSTRFHGLTDADVKGAGAAAEVLPAFAGFARDAVLVGHNVAFDMRFLAAKERVASVRFDNPVLDTMLVSAMLDGEGESLSLDALCGRYGIAVRGRHSALGDARATAELMLRLIDRLEARGLESFGAVMEASDMAAKLRHRAAVVAHGAGGA